MLQSGIKCVASEKTTPLGRQFRMTGMKLPAAALVVGLGLFSASARADLILPPGGAVTLTGSAFNTLGGVAPGATLVASTTGQPVNLIPGGLAGVTINEAVYQEAAGTFDFLFQIVNGSTSTVGSDSFTNYTDPTNTAYVEYVGYASVLPSPAGPFGTLGTLGEPVSANRTVTLGAQDSFTQLPALAAGATSEIFWLRTNATAYDNLGTVTVNGSASNVGVVYEPSGVSVPEPSTLAAGAVVSLALLRRRGRKA